MEDSTLFLTVLGLAGTLTGTIISIVAFLASLRFYRDGRDLNEAANKALTQIAERSGAMQSELKTVSDRVLDAALGKQISTNHTYDLTAITEDIKKEIQTLNKNDSSENKLTSIVESINHLEEKIIHNSKEQKLISDRIASSQLDIIDAGLLNLLSLAIEPKDINEITDRYREENIESANISDERIFRSLNKMISFGLIDSSMDDSSDKPRFTYKINREGRRFITII